MTKFHRTETRYLATHIGRITMIFKSKYFKSKCDKVKTSSDIIAKTLRSKSILLIPSWINCKSVAPQPTEKKYTDGHSWCIFLFATSVGTFCANAPFRYILCYDSDHWLIIRAIILRLFNHSWFSMVIHAKSLHLSYGYKCVVITIRGAIGRHNYVDCNMWYI